MIPALAHERSTAASISLEALIAALAEPREHIESTFVSVGARLSEGATLLNRVTKVFEALPAQLESPELKDAAERLHAVGHEAEAISALFATEQADLARLVEVVTAAHHPIADLRRTVKMMGIVAINARVVAAAVVGDRDDFEVFTTDIAKLSDGANQTLQEFTAVYRQLVDAVESAAQQRQRFETAHAHSLTALAQSLRITLGSVAAQQHLSVESSSETGRVSRQIVGRIAQAVMALQVGDATRQRLEHVEAGLEKMCSLLDGDLLEQDAADIRAAIGTLEAQQLAAATEAFSSDISEANDALAELASDARSIMDRSRSIYGDGAGKSALTQLSTEVRAAAAVLRDCDLERTKLGVVANAVQNTVGILLGHVEAVQEIEANMRLVSLNAAVKCAQLGPRGAALNVIASQLRELTGETVAAAEAAMSGLHEAAELAQSFGATATGAAAGRIGELEQQANGALSLLEAVDRALAEALATLNRDGPIVIRLLGQAANTFGNHSGIAESMADLQLQLLDQCPGELPQEFAPVLVETLSDLRNTYTMDAERQIHDGLFGRAVPMPVAANDQPTEAELDDIFF